jgi:raffinose/stachyose/melibiose transport system permease protein
MRRIQENRTAILVFIAPALIVFTVFVAYPIVQTFLKSFYEWNGLGVPKYIGVRNFVNLFQNSDFYIGLKNGIIFVGVLVVYQIGLGTVLALSMIDRTFKLRNFFKTAFFIPVVLSITVVCQLWVSIYSYDHGLINAIFKALGSSFRQSWLADKNSAIFAIAFTNAWQYMGIQFIFIYAGAQSIPEHLFEAAHIDGASRWRMHFAITIPLLAETYKFCLILAVTGGLQAFSNMFIMTNGGPGTYTYTLTFVMYKLAFFTDQFGYASSASAILVAECLLATILINRFVARRRYTF